MLWKQKGRDRKLRRAKHLFLIDKGIRVDCKAHKTSLAMEWIDLKKNL